MVLFSISMSYYWELYQKIIATFQKLNGLRYNYTTSQPTPNITTYTRTFLTDQTDRIDGNVMVRILLNCYLDYYYCLVFPEGIKARYKIRVIVTKCKHSLNIRHKMTTVVFKDFIEIIRKLLRIMHRSDYAAPNYRKYTLNTNGKAKKGKFYDKTLMKVS